jgi:hydroxymethylglutaryl-CoA reductase
MMSDITEKSSEISGFHKLSVDEKLSAIKDFAGLDDEDLETLKKTGRLGLDVATRMIENVVGTFELPFGVATNFRVNGKDYLIPMVIEEPSVVAAASYSAKLARQGGGFTAETDEPVMIGQAQIVEIPDMEKAKKGMGERKEELIELARKQDSMLERFGGGPRGIETREIETDAGRMLIVHLMVDVRDAMGANAVNTMVEKISPMLEEITGGKVRLRIISNLATKRLARARAVWKKDVLGEDVIDGIIQAYNFAVKDPFRCATHNKGVMNGIDAVTIATGNDFRAVEAGMHSYAAIDGYKPITRYEKDGDGNLVGSIELPIAVGTIGGCTRTNPVAKVSLKMLGVKTAQELAGVMASVGLAQNFAALRALATEGIQRGHLKLHATNLAIVGGASGEMAEKVAKIMIEEGEISASRAEQLVKEMSK